MNLLLLGGKKKFLLSYSDSFSRADGPLGGKWNGATWAISGNTAINVPGLGTELISNGDMETGDPPTGWQTPTGGSLASYADERPGGVGTKCLQITSIGGDNVSGYHDLTTTAGTWLRLGGWYRRGTSSAAFVYLWDSSFATVYNFSTTNTSWTEFISSGLANTATMRAVLRTRIGTNATVYGDDYSCKAITLKETFATIKYAKADMTVGALFTLPNYMQAGVVLNLDNPANPQNFVIGYCDQALGKVILAKCVAGTYTTLLGVTVTYSAGAEVKVSKSGTTYKLYYATIQKGADQTISDAGIISNKNHGLFGTGGGGAATGFFCL